jgi:hypothetical protein
MNETALFTWIHLSDLHYQVNGFDPPRPVRMKLKEDIVKRVNRDECPRPDAILLTGNSIGTNDAEEQETKIWLRALSKDVELEEHRVFVVPGARDVDSSRDSEPTTRRLVRSLREAKHHDDKIDTVLFNDVDLSDRQCLMRRMSRYVTFSKEFMPVCDGPQDRLHWSHLLWGRDGLRVRLVGLNTALLDVDERDGLPGAPRMGVGQITESFKCSPRNRGELGITLTHYPVDGGLLADQDEVQAWIRNHTHVQLSGCPQGNDNRSASTGAGLRFHPLHVGLRKDGPSPAYVYRFASVVRVGEKLLLRVWPRAWSRINKDFRSYSDELSDGHRFYDEELGGWWPGIAKSFSVRHLYERVGRSDYVTYRATRTRSSLGPETEANRGGATDYVIFEKDGRRISAETWVDGNYEADIELLADQAEEYDGVPLNVYSSLVSNLQLESRTQERMLGRRDIADIVVEEKRPPVIHLFEATVVRGNVSIARDGRDIAAATLHEGKIVGTGALLVDNNAEDSDHVYEKLEEEIMRFLEKGT